MDDQFQTRQVDPARGHIGGDADPRPAITQGLQGVHAFLLAEFTRKRHGLKAPVRHAGVKVVHIRPRLAEDDGGLCLVVAQDVEDRVFTVAGLHRQGAVFDIDVLLRLALRGDAEGVLLEGAGQLFDFLRHGGREHQGAPILGRGGEDEFQILGKTQVEHFIGFVQDHGLDARQIERFAFDMVAQAAGGAHHDMRPPLQRAAFVAVIHSAHAGREDRPRFGIEPFELALHLLRQFPRGGHDQGKRTVGKEQAVISGQHVGRDGKAEGHGLARTRLGGNQQVTACDFFGKHGRLNGRKGFITLGRKGRSQRRGNRCICHVIS